MSMNPLRRRHGDAPAAADAVPGVGTERDVERTSVDDRPAPDDRTPAYDDTTPLHTDGHAGSHGHDNSHDRTPDAGLDRDRDHGRDHDRDSTRDRGPGEHPEALDRATVMAREKAAFGGLKLGSAFFGWLTALGTAVLLTALVAAATTAVQVASGNGVPTAATVAAGTGLRTDVAIIVILFLSYYCGGYVAGRMARFDGAKQGLAVWVIAIVAALLITAVGAIAGARLDLLGTLNGFPRLQANGAQITGAGVVTTLIALAAALVGAVLGGLAGMRFHRRVDRAGLGR